MKAFRLGLSQGLLGLVLAAGCSGDKAPARGQIMLALHTDMALPKDISKVKLQVVTAGAKDAGIVKFDRTFTVGADGEAKIPATFAIVAPEGQSPTVEIRVIGIGGTKGRTFSKIVTTVPKDRIAALNMPIQWLCDNTAVTIDSDTFENTCPPVGDVETACVAGTCQDVNFPEVKMPDFSPPDVFGGGKDEKDPSGKCFDTVACFDPGFTVKPDGACRVAFEAPPSLPFNFAVRPTKKTEGICGTKGCYVPLDKSEIFGWSELPPGSSGGGEGGASGLGNDEGAGAGGEAGAQNFGPGSVRRVFQLPKAICDHITGNDKTVDAVFATKACDGKTERVPVCGDWYSVAAQRVTPETSTMTGTGGNGGMQTGSCPEFKPGVGLEPVGNDKQFNGMLQAAADLKTRSDELAKETYDACAGMITDLGGVAPPVLATPSASAVTDTCTTAQKALSDAGSGTIGSNWSVLVTPAKCAISIDDQATCESACSQTSCKNLPSADKRCAQLGGACAGTCNGDCAGTHDAPVTCSGTCEGVCTGTCAGECISTEGTPGATNCAGWCSGDCVGKCAGTCVQEASGGTCEGVCWTETGACVGKLTDLVCEGELTPEDCLGDCGTLCAARASLAQVCETPTAEVYGTAPPLLRTAIDDHYWMLLDAITRAAGITSAGPAISQLQAKYATDSATVSDAHLRSCLNAAQNAISAAYTGLSAVITAASQTANAVAGGGNVGGTCQPSADSTDCTLCLMGSCCPQLTACTTDSACNGTGEAGEFQCVSDCYHAGNNASVCEQGPACKASGTATFSTATLNLLACTHNYCQSLCLASPTTNCQTGQTFCNGQCRDLTSDATNCGFCGNDCLAGQICTNSTCTCAGTLALCPSGCVDLQNDRANCGKCGALCGGSTLCMNGSCVGSGGAGGAGGVSGSAGAAATGNAGGSSAGGAGGFAGGTSGGVGGGSAGGSAGSAGTAGTSTAVCPTSEPPGGSGCPQQGLQCIFGADTCTCTADGWSCPMF